MAAFAFLLLVLLVPPACSRLVLPEHLMHGEIAEELCSKSGTCTGRLDESAKVKGRWDVDSLIAKLCQCLFLYNFNGFCNQVFPINGGANRLAGHYNSIIIKFYTK